MDNCLFCKFATKKEPKEFLYEDNDVMVFPDIHPVRPTHLLIVPKKHFSDLLEVNEKELLSKLLETVKKMAVDLGLDKKGYRMLVNGGGAQQIPHLHFHLYGPVDSSTLL